MTANHAGDLRGFWEWLEADGCAVEVLLYDGGEWRAHAEPVNDDDTIQGPLARTPQEALAGLWAVVREVRR